MTKEKLATNAKRLAVMITTIALACAITQGSAAAQSAAPQSVAQPAPFRGDDKSVKAQPVVVANDATETDPYFKNIYRGFYSTYKLGPADEVAIRIVGQPDYTLEKAQVSPVGRLYHPLIGDVEVAGLTVSQLTEKLTLEFGQYIREPRVSVSLITANSSMIGVLGDVIRPGIVVMSRPMTVLDAISASGGVSDLGSQSNITLVRRGNDGNMRTMKVNLKRVLDGKAGAEDNVALQAGDTLIVHGNAKKKIGFVTSMLGFGRFIDFIVRR
jgi:polysaccharide export outer membrane protein